MELAPARAVVDALAARHLADGRAPGLAVVATDADGVLLAAYHGLADAAAGTPVHAGTVFQIGSISKVFTAVLAVQQWQDGTLDPHVPVRVYLPWLPAAPYAHVTPHLLLSHTAGLAQGCDIAPPSPYMALAAVDPPPVPGAGFHYSDAGFQVMGLVLEATSGRPYGRLLAERILEPLGMTGSFPLITGATRPATAVGYAPSPDDLPYGAGHGIAPAPWYDYTAADASVACTAADLAAFARMLARGGAGALTPEGFALLTTPVADAGDDDAVCYGIFADEVPGYRRLRHGGDMVGFESWLHVDRDLGLAVVTLTNGRADSEPVCRGTLEALRALRTGRAVAVPPAPPSPPLADFVGTYGPRAVTVSGGTLHLDGTPLRHLRGESFTLPGSPYPVRFERAASTDTAAGDTAAGGADRDDGGRVVALVHGPDWWTVDGPATQPPPDPDPNAYPGRYRAYRPFDPTFRVLVRRGAVLLAWPGGGESTLTPTAEPGTFTLDGTLEVLRFDTPANGRTLRAVLSGCPFYRTMAD